MSAPINSGARNLHILSSIGEVVVKASCHDQGHTEGAKYTKAVQVLLSDGLLLQATHTHSSLSNV